MWPPQRRSPDDDVLDTASPRSATSTVVSRTLSEPEAQPQRRVRGVDRACSPICEAPSEGPPPSAMQPPGVEFSYPPLDCLLGEQAGDSGALAPEAIQAQPVDIWILELEPATAEAREGALLAAAGDQTTQELLPGAGQPLDLLGQIPTLPADQVLRPWRTAARRAAEGVPDRHIPVKAPPRTKPQPCRVGSEPERRPPDQGRASHSWSQRETAGDAADPHPASGPVDHPQQAAPAVVRSRPQAAGRGRVRIADRSQDSRPPHLEPDQGLQFTVSIFKPAPIQTMLPLGWERVVPRDGPQYFYDLTGGYESKWAPPRLHPVMVVAPNWAEHRNIHGQQYWTRAGQRPRDAHATYRRPLLRPTSALAEYNHRNQAPPEDQPVVRLAVADVVMWGLATPVTLAILRCTQRAALLSQRWAVRWFLPQLSERLFRWLPTHAREELNRTMANSRRLRRQILMDHMDPPVVYLGDDGVDESRPYYSHAHPSRSELGPRRSDWFRHKSVRRLSRALSRTRSPSRSARARWASQPGAVSAWDAVEGGRDWPHGASQAEAPTAQLPPPAQRVEPWPVQSAQASLPRADPAQTGQAAAAVEAARRSGSTTTAVLFVDGHRLESRGPAGVCPCPDSHALFPLPQGWTLHHDVKGRLYRARKDPVRDQWVSQWRHPARAEDPVQLPRSGHWGAGAASPVLV